jgi:hypothetical protein
VFHPSPSPESGKGFLAAGFLLRRNRTIRSLQRGIFALALSSLLIETGSPVNASESRREQSGIIRRRFS